MNVVIADNESLIRMDLKEMLEDAGHTVVGEAANGQMAVALTEKQQPDIVIMDIKMPVMDGIEAAKMIWQKKLAPVLLLTAYSQTEIVEKANDSGVLAYLVKPVREDTLFPAMQIALTRFKETRQLENELNNVKNSLALRKDLDRAKGIIMDTYRLSEAEAYRRIQQYSMIKRKPIKEIVSAILKASKKYI